ncbi:MAG TPA: LytTR family DNA-binding domain-containing protein [Flavipsychrobacter sp.]
MKVVIVEDELPAYKRLVKLLGELLPDAEITAHHDSVSTAKQWFEENEAPAIVFMDIHLADGSAFDLLKQVKIDAPIIFTTAYDQYAIEAFKASGVGYLLKPIKSEDLEEALDKLNDLKKLFSVSEDKQEKLLEALKQPEYKKRFMIRFGDNIKTIAVEDIAYFFSENKGTFARMFEDRTYPIDNNLDALEQMLDPEKFFRINRQYIISLKAIKEMKTYSKARVLVKLQPEVKEPPLVSSERSAGFKLWLAGEL